MGCVLLLSFAVVSLLWEEQSHTLALHSVPVTVHCQPILSWIEFCSTANWWSHLVVAAYLGAAREYFAAGLSDGWECEVKFHSAPCCINFHFRPNGTCFIPSVDWVVAYLCNFLWCKSPSGGLSDSSKRERLPANRYLTTINIVLSRWTIP